MPDTTSSAADEKAFAPRPLLAAHRLDSRGLIDVQAPQRNYARAAAWMVQRFALSGRLLDRMRGAHGDGMADPLTLARAPGYPAADGQPEGGGAPASPDRTQIAPEGATARSAASPDHAGRELHAIEADLSARASGPRAVAMAGQPPQLRRLDSPGLIRTRAGEQQLQRMTAIVADRLTLSGRLLARAANVGSGSISATVSVPELSSTRAVPVSAPRERDGASTAPKFPPVAASEATAAAADATAPLFASNSRALLQRAPEDRAGEEINPALPIAAVDATAPPLAPSSRAPLQRAPQGRASRGIEPSLPIAAVDATAPPFAPSSRALLQRAPEDRAGRGIEPALPQATTESARSSVSGTRTIQRSAGVVSEVNPLREGIRAQADGSVSGHASGVTTERAAALALAQRPVQVIARDAGRAGADGVARAPLSSPLARWGAERNATSAVSPPASASVHVTGGATASLARSASPGSPVDVASSPPSLIWRVGLTGMDALAPGSTPALRRGVNAGAAAAQTVYRQPDGAPDTSSPALTGTGSGAPVSAPPGVPDLNALADQVTRLIARRLDVERERRGSNPWL